MEFTNQDEKRVSNEELKSLMKKHFQRNEVAMKALAGDQDAIEKIEGSAEDSEQ